LVHTPGDELFFGFLEPDTFLFERRFSFLKARNEHDHLKDILQHKYGVRVHELREIILKQAMHRPRVKRELVQLGVNAAKFAGTERDVKKAFGSLRKGTRLLDIEFFFDSLLLNPTTHMGTPYPHVSIEAPLANLFFVRDQQAVTDRGIVIGNPFHLVRRRETQVTRFAFELLGLPICHQISGDATLEGGDFMPMKDFALVGMGARTNEEGVKQLLKNGVDFDEVAVVHQPYHPDMPYDNLDPMVTMHLDTYFNVVSDGVVVGNPKLMRNAVVEIFGKASRGKYLKQRAQTNLYEYIRRQKSFDVVPIEAVEQMCYASNFLCIKSGEILAVNVARNVPRVLGSFYHKRVAEDANYKKFYKSRRKEARRLKKCRSFFPNKRELRRYGIECELISLPNLTGGYGGAHCMTCSLYRG